MLAFRRHIHRLLQRADLPLKELSQLAGIYAKLLRAEMAFRKATQPRPEPAATTQASPARPKPVPPVSTQTSGAPGRVSARPWSGGGFGAAKESRAPENLAV